MKFLDVDSAVIARLYDLLQAEFPKRVERQRTEVRMSYENVPEGVIRRHVVQRLLEEDRQVYLVMRSRLAARTREPMRSSPLDQIRAMTAILNPMGERTGGNFRAAL